MDTYLLVIRNFSVGRNCGSDNQPTFVLFTFCFKVALAKHHQRKVARLFLFPRWIVDAVNGGLELI